MAASSIRVLRMFVGVSLLAGGVALAAGAQILRDASGVPAWIGAAVLLWLVGLASLLSLAQMRAWPWPVPAASLVVSLMLGVIWARFDVLGHDVLSGITPFVAFVTGVGILYRARWAWPVAFASVTGFGPIILLFAPLPETVIVGAFVLFVVDAIALLALAESFFENHPSA